ncbi:M48 family metallopeptidase [Aestuariibius sp. HNIBRBA575]|uniref:M48 family metallopeptidase n=1 Tax=Aestuariibius sp. HNIBRBA575 TaxID=3233343 RepID=UPI0034A0D66C
MSVIHVGAAAEPAIAVGMWLPGDSAEPISVRLEMDDTAGQMSLTPDGRDGTKWAYANIRRLADQAGGDHTILHLADDPVQRLIITSKDDMDLIAGRARQLGKRPRLQRPFAMMGWGLAAVGSVVLIITVLIPLLANQLADWLPAEGEKALGDVTLEQIRGALDADGFGGLRICDDPDGIAALTQIQDRLAPHADLPYPLQVTVLDHPMVNAFALPGGHVVFFDGLLQRTQSPEEVAAVFAHEMGHVEHRDATRVALRSAGSVGVLGLLFGDFAGGALLLFASERLIQADYNRTVEADADSYAYRVLLAADLPPSAIATFFERMQGNELNLGIAQHFMSHPELGDRIQAARDATPEDAVFNELLTPDQWASLQQICR